MGFRDGLADGEPQPQAAELPGDLAVALLEGFEHALQLETIGLRSLARSCATTRFPAQHDFLHLKSIGAHNMEAVAGRIWSRVARMEKLQQHTSGFQHRPQPSHDRLHQALIEIIRQVPTQHHIEVRGGVDQVVGQKLPAVQSGNPFLVLDKKFRIG